MEKNLNDDYNDYNYDNEIYYNYNFYHKDS